MRLNKRSSQTNLVRSANDTEIVAQLVCERIVGRTNTATAADVEAVGDGDQDETRNVVVGVLHSKVGQVEVVWRISFVRYSIDRSMERIHHAGADRIRITQHK